MKRVKCAVSDVVVLLRLMISKPDGYRLASLNKVFEEYNRV